MLTTDRVGAAGYDASNFTDNFGGTSSATPVVAGVAALVLSANPDLTAQQVKRILQETADKIIDSDPDPQLGLRKGTYDGNGHCQWFGYGKVNAARGSTSSTLRCLRLHQMLADKYREANYNSLAIPDNDRQGC